MKSLVTMIRNLFIEPLLEMARVDDPTHDSDVLNKKEIWVYGNDRTSMSPLFHYFATDKSFDLEIDIITLKLLKSSSRKDVRKQDLTTWEGLTKERKKLKDWLLRKSYDIPQISNYELLLTTWNQNNRSNPIIKPLNLFANINANL